MEQAIRTGDAAKGLRQLSVLIALAIIATIPALYLRYSGLRPSAVLDMGVFGSAILAAGFLLSWGAEAAEGQVSAGLILAGIAIVTVLPEYAVDMYYAFEAGKAPGSNYVHYAAANMTGANRLLVGAAWPAMVVLHWWRTKERGITLGQVNAIEIVFLLIASLYAFMILITDEIWLIDSLVLISVFGFYLWRVSKVPKTDEAEIEPGPAAALETLPVGRQWTIMIALTVVAATVIFASAEPFAESMIDSGRVLGINEFLLIQWLAPLASEAPAVTIAILFVLSRRAAGGLTTMISDKINQWTLLVGMLPLAMSVGAGGLTSLPLDARQHEEFFLTATQSLFGIALLLRLRLSLVSALALAGLFAVQVGLAFHFRENEASTIRTLTWLGWLYLGLAAIVFLANYQRLGALIRMAFWAPDDVPDGGKVTG